MILYYDNQIDTAETITGTPSLAAYPASNLQDQRLTRIYRGDKYTELLIDSGGAEKSITQAYINRVDDPTDLTAVSWTTVSTTVTDSGETLEGYKLWTVTGNAVATFQRVESNPFTCGSDLIIFRSVCRKGTSDETLITIYNNTTVATAGQATIDFTTKTVTPAFSAIILDELWYDDTTLCLVIQASQAAITSGDSLELRLYSNGSTAGTLSTLWSQPQFTQGTLNRFPFVDGSKTADVISESFTMPDKFTIDLIIRPDYDYNTTTQKHFIRWTNGSALFSLTWGTGSNKLVIQWIEGGTSAFMISQQFDDGTSLTNLNQRLRVIGSFDLVSADANASRFIVIPLEEGAAFEDSTFSATPDIKELTYNTLLIGTSGTINQADTRYEYVRVYEGLLTGTITTYDEAEDALLDKELLFNETYQSKILASDILFANTTMRDGDTIRLRANNIDTFDSGTPLDETVDWDDRITHHNFTQSRYQYWWISVNSSNVIDIGRIFLGEGYTTPGVGPTVTAQYQSSSIKGRSTGGQTYGDKRHLQWLFTTVFPALTHDQKREFERIMEEIDITKPLFIEFNEDCSDLTRYYVTINQDELRFTVLSNNQYYTTSIDWIEEK